MKRRLARRFGALALALVPIALGAGERRALAQQAPAPFDPAKELLRIAKMKQDDRVLAGFAEARGRSAPNLTEKELFLIVDTVERVGTPDRAIAMLEARVRKFPRDLEARVTLAKMFVRASQTPRAAGVWKELAATLGLTPSLAIEYARALSVTGDHAGALAVLVGVMGKAPDDALDYWRELARVAWDQDDSATALVAYRKVYASEPPFPAASSRLMQLLSDAGRLDEAFDVAKQALVRERNPAPLLLVARLHARRGEWAAAKRTLDLADDQRARIASTLDYWMLRAEILSQMGEKDGARAAHRTALSLDQAAPGARAALLWDSIERSDLRTLSVDLGRWAPDASRDHEMWAPVAIGLDRVGRPRDAIRFFALQSKATPDDHLFSLEFADALGRAGEEGLAAQLRRRAFAGIRGLAARSAPASALPDKLLETHVFLTQRLRGVPEAERWVRRMLAAERPTLALEELAVGWYLQEDNADRARRHLARARKLRLDRASAQRHALMLAMVDDDRIEIERIVESSSDLSNGERAAAYLRLERDDRAVRPLVALLDRSDIGGDAPATSAGVQPDADAVTLWRELRGIGERSAPTLRGGGTFAYVNDLAVGGPVAGGSLLAGDTRIVYGAGARRFIDFGTAAVDVDGRIEADAEILARRLGPRHAQEGRLGVDYQTDTPNGIPMPRAGYKGVFQLSKRVGASVDAVANGRIEDTSFLRVAGLRDAVNFDLSLEPVDRAYVIGSVVVLEDHTRSFDYLGVEAGGGVEGGYKLMRRVPEWTLGARVGVYGRDNRSDVPSDFRSIVKPGETRGSLYPPSYQQAMLVMRIARGDFFERSREELVAFPRYDCEVNAGILTGLGIRGAVAAAAGAARCAVGVRMPTGGYLSATAEYIKGVTGLAQADNAHLGLSYTQFLR